MGKSTNYIQQIFLALFFGAIIPVSFAPWGWWITSLIGVSGLVMLLQNGSPRHCFMLAFCFGISMFAVGVSWIYVSIHTHGNTPMPIAILLTAGFVFLLAFVFAVPFLLLGLTHSRNTLSLLYGFPSIWVLGEMLRGWIFSGFPWLYLGNAFVDTWLSGWGPIAGVFGMSWLVAFASSLLVCLLRWKTAKNNLEVAVFLLVVFCISGIYLSKKPWTVPAGDTFTVGMIQPAIPLKQKWNRDELVNIIQNYQETNKDLLDNDLIVWPESAIPALRKDVAPFLANLNTTALETHTGIIMGIPTTNPAGNRYYNTVIGLGYAEGEYHKQHLVPFGEYVPFENILRGLIGFFDLPMSSFSAGPDGQRLMTFRGFQVGTAICYEIAYPNLVRDLAGSANLLVTVSNDAWFGGTIGPHQHLQIARMRALENGKPLIRATNDGVSAIIDQKGRVIAKIPQFKATTLEGWIAPHRGQTPFNQFGNTPLTVILLVILLITAGVKESSTKIKVKAKSGK